MWKGIKKALGHRSKSQKNGPADVSIRSNSSTAHSSNGALFPFDMAELDAALTTSDQQEAKRRQHAVASDANWGQSHQQLQQQHSAQQAEDSMSRRRAAAMQKRVSNAMLSSGTCLYQIKALLSLSTLFEHKLQRDTIQALQQHPSGSLSSLAAPSTKQQGLHNDGKKQQLSSSTLQQHLESTSAMCVFCRGCAADSTQSGLCCCQSGGPASMPMASATAASTAHVALLLASWGYRVIVRKVLHSKAYWTKSMDNTFIVALDSSSGSHVEYVVDPHFQEAFNVGVMSENYRAIWQALPQVFVGMPCQLQSAVQLLCEEVELSFLEAGRPCPPWRGWAATINRWMSDQFVDILVPGPGSSNEELVEYMARCTHLSNSGCSPGSVASTASTGTHGSSTAVSTCSPLGGFASQQRLGDKVHVSSVLSSASTCKDRRVPEPLQQQVGFDAGAQQLQQDVPACEGQHQHRLAGNGGMESAHTDELLVPVQRDNSTSSCASGSQRSKSLLTAQMQSKQQLHHRQKCSMQQLPTHMTSPVNLLNLQQQQHLLLQLQHQQMQQQQHVAEPPQHMQMLMQQQQQLQIGAQGLPVVHTVRPCGAVDTAAAKRWLGATASAVPVPDCQQLLLVQAQHQQQHVLQGSLAAVAVPHHEPQFVSRQQQLLQQQQQPGPATQVQPNMHLPDAQPKLLRLIPRSKQS